MKDTYCVLTFHSTYHALQCEKLLQEEGIDIKLIPVPRKISTSCGTAGEVNCEDKNIILEICKNKNIEYSEFHYIDREVNLSWYKKLVKKQSL